MGAGGNRSGSVWLLGSCPPMRKLMFSADVNSAAFSIIGIFP
jgi:hypothetical protein